MCPEEFPPPTQSAQAPPGHPSVPRPEADSLQPLLPSHPGEHVCPLGIPILLHGDQARLRDSLHGTPGWAPPASLGGSLSATWLWTHSVPTNASKSPLRHKQRHSRPILPRSASYTLFRRFSASVYTALPHSLQQLPRTWPRGVSPSILAIPCGQTFRLFLTFCFYRSAAT